MIRPLELEEFLLQHGCTEAAVDLPEDEPENGTMDFAYDGQWYETELDLHERLYEGHVPMAISAALKKVGILPK